MRDEATVFANTRSEFRFLVYSKGFFGADRVLMFGVHRLAIAPFIAESCGSLTLSDFSVESVRRAAQLCRAFSLPVTTLTAHNEAKLKFADASFDRIWVDGAMLCKLDTRRWFAELRRVLAPSGVLFVHRAPALGAFLTELSREQTASKRQVLSAMLQAGFAKQNPVRYFPARDLRSIVSHLGFGLDRDIAVSKHMWTRDRSPLDRLANDEVATLRSRYLTEQEDWTKPGLIDFFLDFALIKRS